MSEHDEILEKLTSRFYNDPAGFSIAFTRIFTEQDGTKQELYPKQVEFLNLIKKEENVTAIVKCRQSGFSTCIQAKALHRAYFGKVPEILITSAGQNQATRVLRKIKYFFETLPEFMRVEFEKDTDTQVRLPNGTTIYSLPANPATCRGFTGAAFLDEFGVMSRKDGDEMWEALLPCIAKGYDIVAVSTPKGKQNMFYDLCNPKKDADGNVVGVRAKKVIKLPWWDVPHIAAVAEDFRNAMTAKQFAQEFECQFVEDSIDSLFSYDFMLDHVVDAREDGLSLINLDYPISYDGEEIDKKRRDLIDAYPGGIYAGWDVAITGDGSILTIFGVNSADIWELIAYHKFTRGMDLSEQSAITSRICQYLCVNKLTFDGTGGLGLATHDNLKKTAIRQYIVPFQFTPASKAQGYSDLKSKMAQEGFRIPDIQECVNEFTNLGINPVTGRIGAQGSWRTHHDDWPSSFLCAFAGRRRSLNPAGFSWI